MNIDSIITLCIFMIVHLCGTIWWMSKINTTLGFLANQVADIVKTIATHEATYAKRDDMCRELGRLEIRIDGAFKRIDEINAR